MSELYVDNPGGGEGVDGFSDTQGDTNIGSPDPGTEGSNKPMSPDEYAEAQKEAREDDDK